MEAGQFEFRAAIILIIIGGIAVLSAPRDEFIGDVAFCIVIIGFYFNILGVYISERRKK
jgi:disulfide bond formation protein DsbB